MDYTVKKLASMSGVSVRTLHHYHAIGLLKPARIGENNYRYYGSAEALRLQQILFYRELGLSLDEIGEVLDSTQFETLRALRQHSRELERRRQRLDALQRTVERTILKIQGELTMNDQELFQGFAGKDKESYRRKLREYYGAEAEEKIDESFRRTRGWSKKDFEVQREKMDDINRRLTEALEAGEAHDSGPVQQLVIELHDYINQFWTADTAAFKALGEMYVENPDFRATYDAWHPELAEFLRAAIHHYCDARQQ